MNCIADVAANAVFDLWRWRLLEMRACVRIPFYFGKVIAAINRQGGEVLKLMGGAVLAIFPAEDVCICTLASSKAIVNALGGFRYGGQGPRAGIALHYGDKLWKHSVRTLSGLRRD